MRNWHYLHAGRAVGWPQQSIALSVVCSAGRMATPGAYTRHCTLLGWSALAWMGREGQLEEEWHSNGVSCNCFWSWLDTRLKRGRTTWIWQMSALHGIAALNGWAVIGGRIGSLCVLSDPPTILLAKPFDSRRACTFLDLRNLSPGASWGGLAGDGDGGDLRAQEADGLQCGRVAADSRARTLATWLQAWYETVRSLNLGGLRATAAAQSWHGWRGGYLDVPIEVHCDTDRLGVERDSIYGGRCEVYRVGHAQGRVREIDATAHYPACAISAPLPGRLARGATGDGRTIEAATRAGLLVFARGRVRTETPCLPCRRWGITVYPIGIWRATYCWPECQLAQRCGATVEIEKWWGYEPTEPFTRFYGRLFQARKDADATGNSSISDAIKLLANGLIGKCCASGRYWRDCPDQWYPDGWAAWPHYNVETDSITRMRSIAGRVQEEVIEDWADEAIPALAAWVYSLGRVRLWDWLQVAGMDEVHYTDTDSLWTTERGYDRLNNAGQIRDGELGRLRVRKTHPWARFYGHKHYECPSGLVCAGKPRNVLLGTEDKRDYWRAERVSESCASERAPASTLVRQEIADRSTYRGGRIGADGRVYPWEVWDYD